MNIFHQFAAKSLKGNRTRTLVTIVGITLSVAMLTAVTTIISSILAYGIAYETKTLGNWHVNVKSVDEQTMHVYEEDKRVAQIYALRMIGYAYMEESGNQYKPYLCIEAMNEEFAENMPIHLTGGRMPEKENEVLIPDHVAENAGVEFSIGDTLTLSVGLRETADGERLWQNDALVVSSEETDAGNDNFECLEYLTEEQQQTYTVVGFYERPYFEEYSAPGYTVLTMDSGQYGSDYYDCYVVMKHPGQAIDFWEEVSDEGIYLTSCNNSLLRFYGFSVREDFNALIYGMGGILTVIIVLGSVALIYNAFAISVSERTKQFGLLSSIGATRKQMKKTVCFEALLLCVVGIPLGVLSGICGIGVTLSFFSDTLEYLVGAERGVEFKLAVSGESVAVAAVIGMITVLISAYLPMRRALKLSAIDAIRQNHDIRLTKKKVRIPKWVEKCFGLEGMIAWKNFRRNKKQYRATILSLALSILLFVTAGSFSEYLFGGYQGAVEISGYDVSVELADVSYEDIHNSMEQAKSVEGSSAAYEFIYFHPAIKAETDSLTDMALEFYENTEMEEIELGNGTAMVMRDAVIQFLPEDAYEDLIHFYELEEEKYLDISHPKAVIFNSIMDYTGDEGREIQMLKQDCQTITYVVDTEEEVMQRTLEIGDIVDNTPSWSAEFSDKCLAWAGGNYQLQILYPLSAAGDVLKGVTSEYDIHAQVDLIAEDHAAVAETLEEKMEGNVIVYDAAESENQYRMMLLMLNVFSYGFIILISLISAANVFNTISTNMGLRRREFAMLKSVGMTQRGFLRMLNFECLIYGIKGLFYGFLVTVPTVMFMYYLGFGHTLEGFYLPWRYAVIAVLCVFAVVYATMLYAQTKAKKEDIIEALKGDAR